MAQPRTRADQALSQPSLVDSALAPVDPAPATAPQTRPQPAPSGIVTTKDGRVVLARAGGFVSVNPYEAELALREPSTRLATPEEWDKHQLSRETSLAEEVVKEGTAAAATGVMTVARLPAMISDLAGGPGSDFLRDTSPTGVRAAVSAAWDALTDDPEGAAEAWDSSMRQQRLAEELFPTARAVARTGGEMVGSVAALGGLGAWAGGARTAAGVAGRSALAAGSEGVASGMAEEYRESMLENRAVDRELLISNGLIGGVLSAAVGAGVGFAGKKIGDAVTARKTAAQPAADAPTQPAADAPTQPAADAPTQPAADAPTTPTRTRAVAATERAVAESADDLDRPALQLEQELAEREARVAKAAAEAGANPNAQRAAAEAAAQREADELRDIAGADFDPAQWRDAATDKVKPIRAFIHRETIQEGATEEVKKHLDDMITGTPQLTDILREVPLKREQVARKLAADGIDETAAIATAQAQQEAFATELSNITAELGARQLDKTRVGKFILKQFSQAHETAAKKLASAPDAAEAFIVRDQFRRDAEMIRRQVNDSLQKSTGIADREAARVLQPWAEAKYLETANTLFDEKTWKSMGAFQQAANGRDGWVGLIDADRVGLNNFASVKSYDLRNKPVLEADPDKIRSYIQRIDSASMRDGQIRRIIEKRASMVKTLKEGLALTPQQQATADRVLKAAEQSLSALDDAEKVAIRLNRQAKLNEADRLLNQGGVVTRLLGGLTKALQGNFREAAALQVGGQEVVAKQIQALRISAKGNESRMVRGIIKALEVVSGDGSPNQAALANLQKRARAAGVIDDTAEKLSRRMRDQNFALAPLFKPAYDREPSESREVYARRRDVLADLVANPDAAQRALEPVLHRAMIAHPEMGVQLGADITERIQRLQAALPGQPLPSLLPSSPSARRDMVSAQELRQAEAMLAATLDPTSVFDDFAAGKLDYDKLRFAKEQYPELFNVARAFALDMFRDLPADLQGNMATQLDFLLDFDGQLDPTLSPEFLKRQRERFEQRQQQMQNRPPPRPAPNTGANAQTYTQRLAGV